MNQTETIQKIVELLAHDFTAQYRYLDEVSQDVEYTAAESVQDDVVEAVIRALIAAMPHERQTFTVNELRSLFGRDRS